MSDTTDSDSEKAAGSMSSRLTRVDKPDSRVTIRLIPRSIANGFLCVVLLIVVAGTVANYCIYHVVSSPDSNAGKVLKRFDLGHEPSLPNMYSSFALLIAAGLLTLIGFLERRSQQDGWNYWFAMAIVFLGLAIDEAVQFHEMIDAAINRIIQTSGLLYLPWVIVGGIFVVVFAVYFIPFVARKSKRTLRLFVFAGAVFVFGAIGMEMVAGVIFEAAGSEELGIQSVLHTVSQSIEELCEMLGIVLFIYALLDYLATHYKAIDIRFCGS